MRRLLMVPTICLLLLTGCTEDQDGLQRGLDSILAEVHAYEQDITEREDRLRDLEKKEQTLFGKTVELNIEEREALESNVSRLRSLLEEREEALDEEDTAIQEAEKTAKQLRTLPEAETDGGRRAAADLKDALDRRYELHRQVSSEYRELLERQRLVYDLLIDENVKRVQLEETVAGVNEQQRKLADSIRVFSQSTDEVNTALKETQQAEEE